MGNKMKELRLKTGLSQVEFANKYHLSVRTLQRWERGQTEIPEHIYFLIFRVIELEMILQNLQTTKEDKE